MTSSLRQLFPHYIGRQVLLCLSAGKLPGQYLIWTYHGSKPVDACSNHLGVLKNSFITVSSHLWSENTITSCPWAKYWKECIQTSQMVVLLLFMQAPVELLKGSACIVSWLLLWNLPNSFSEELHCKIICSPVGSILWQVLWWLIALIFQMLFPGLPTSTFYVLFNTAIVPTELPNLHKC